MRKQERKIFSRSIRYVRRVCHIDVLVPSVRCSDWLMSGVFDGWLSVSFDSSPWFHVTTRSVRPPDADLSTCAFESSDETAAIGCRTRSTWSLVLNSTSSHSVCSSTTARTRGLEVSFERFSDGPDVEPIPKATPDEHFDNESRHPHEEVWRHNLKREIVDDLSTHVETSLIE